MSEGTKIGEFKQDDQFNTAVKRQKSGEESHQELQATKIGAISEFEKDLYDSEQPEAATSDRESAESDDGSTVEEAVMSADKDQDDIFKDAMSKVADYQEGDIIKGVVRRVEKAGVLVDISYKSDGYIANAEYSSHPEEQPESLSPGDPIDVYIMKLESKEGYTVLSRKRAEYEGGWNAIAGLAKSKEAIEVHVTSSVQGGLVAEYKGIKGFIPASQLVKDQDDKLDRFVGETLPVVVLQADRKRRKIIFSNKSAKRKMSKQEIGKILETIEVGQVREGHVTSVKDFGVFVDIGGVEGLVHISELSWSRVSHPSELLKIGDKVKVFVLGVDKENGRISLGIRQLQPDPWVKVSETYDVGQVVQGTISRMLNFGAFMKIDKDLEGLIHISELSSSHVKAVEDVLQVGQEIEAKIIKLLPDEQKIGLSIKALEEEDEQNSTASEPEDLNEEAAVETDSTD